MRSLLHGERSRALTLMTLCALLAGSYGCDTRRTTSEPWVDPNPEPYEPPTPTPPEPLPEPTPDRDWDGTPDALDCAPDDYLSFRSLELFEDGDGDGYTAGEAVTVCVGDSLLGYAEESKGPDCDDADDDGYGTGVARDVCAGRRLPRYFADNATDCDPSDGQLYQQLAYEFRDADGDNYTVPATGTVCSGEYLPSGYSWLGEAHDPFEEPIVDCLDSDEFGAGEAVTRCTGDSLPAGYVHEAGDCAPDDPNARRLIAYEYRDLDNDYRSLHAPGSACAWWELPKGYYTYNPYVGSPEDCNDDDARLRDNVVYYVDQDGDGVGAGMPQRACTDGKVPAGTSASGSDCAAEDATRWYSNSKLHVDRDGDGFTTPDSSVVCHGASVEKPFHLSARGNDCDDSKVGLTRFMALYPDDDGDGVGAYPYEVLCIGEEIPEGFSRYGDDANDRDPEVGPEEDDNA
jgi:hypothetical protein